MKKLSLILVLILSVGLLVGCSEDNSGTAQYKLQTEVQGEGTVSPETGTHNYDKNTEVTLEATPKEGWEFQEWQGIDSSNNPTTVVMDGELSAVAVFSQVGGGVTKEVSNKDEFMSAVDNSEVGTIKLEEDILLDTATEDEVEIDRLVNIDLNRNALRANIKMTSEAEGTAKISLGILDGDLTVNTPQATVENHGDIRGTLTIEDVSSNSFINHHQLNEVVIKDSNGGRLLNEGTIKNDVDIQSENCTKNVILDGDIPTVKVTGEGAKVQIASTGTVANMSVEAERASISNNSSQAVDQATREVGQNTENISNGSYEMNISDTSVLDNTRVNIEQAQQNVGQIIEENEQIDNNDGQLYDPLTERVVGSSTAISIEDLSTSNELQAAATDTNSGFSNYIESTVDISNAVDSNLSDSELMNQYKLLVAVITDSGIGIKRVDINDIINGSKARADVPVTYNGLRANQLVISVLETTVDDDGDNQDGEYETGADFEYQVTDGEFPKLVSFDASMSKSSEHIKEYQWLFGTGESSTTVTEPTTNYIYGVSGQYDVVLRVTYENGETDTIRKTITLDGEEQTTGENDIRVTLSWNRDVDMDLHVNAPNDSIDFTNTIGADGGELDHDIIHPSSSEWNAPYRENITWEAGEAVQGTYKIGVNYFSARNESGPVEVRATVRVNEGTDNEIVKQYGPYVINEPDYNGDDSDAWWHVIKLDYPAGEFSEISDDSDINLNIEPTEQTKKKKKIK